MQYEGDCVETVPAAQSAGGEGGTGGCHILYLTLHRYGDGAAGGYRVTEDTFTVGQVWVG